MKRLIALAARTYPAAWRQRYGVEFQALLDSTNPKWQDIVNVLLGGFQMRLTRAQPVLTAASLGIMGAVVAGAIAFNVPDRFASSSTLRIQGAPAAAPETVRPDDLVPGLARAAFSADALGGIIERHGLYPGERARRSRDDVVNRMRGDIYVQLVSPSVFQVSFASSDGRIAQQVAQDLVNQLTEPREGLAAQVIDPPDEPQTFVNPRRVVLASTGGFGGGTLLGLLLTLFRRVSPGLE